MSLIPEIVKNKSEMARWRHDIHKHPELPLLEQRTSSRIAELLRSFGFDEVVEQVGQTSVIGVLHQGKGPMIGLTAAMDAQEIQESGFHREYHSEQAGCMHALGHDGEIAMLLGAAQYLAKTRKFKGSVVCIFYSSQGNGIGVRAMIEEGLFDRYPITGFFALHSMPNLPIGSIELSAGALMGAVAELFVKIIGSAGNVAFPHRANNPILAAAAVVNSLETLAANTFDPASPLLVSVTSFVSGYAFDEIAEEAELKGSVRFLDPKIGKWLPGRIDTLVSKIAESYDTQSIVSYRMVCPATINDTHKVRFVREVAIEMLGDANVLETHPMTLIGNDLGYFFLEKPGVCIPIGNGDEANLLDPLYDFNDEVLPVGAALLVRLVERYLVHSKKK